MDFGLSCSIILSHVVCECSSTISGMNALREMFMLAQFNRDLGCSMISGDLEHGCFAFAMHASFQDCFAIA